MNGHGDAREQVIPILRVKDATAAAIWYEQLGFSLTDVHRFEPDLPAFATIERGQMTLFLSEHTLVYLRVHDARALASRFGITPDENPWGPDFAVRDPDGNRLRIGTPSWWTDK
jgi:catechol 2,3-dioxygenase-like lactoylglutathione lyase family enzyme